MDYVHGYAEAEGRRLADQAAALRELLHAGTAYPAGSTVLEVGCGTGAQTVTLIRNSPGARFTCLDRSEESLAAAARRVEAAGLAAPVFRAGDLYRLPFPAGSFDHVFVCFVLEHLSDPAAALREVRRVLRDGGSCTAIEGDHGSTLFHPEDAAGRGAVDCLVRLQRRAGGDPDIGRRLYPLLAGAGLGDVRVVPLPVYVDGSRPEMRESFVRRTFTAMVSGVREEAVRAGLVEAGRFDAGVRALERAAEGDGVFVYTFFRGVGVNG